MGCKFPPTREELKMALRVIDKVLCDGIQHIYEQYLEGRIGSSCGYHAIRYDPRTGEAWYHAAPSWEESADEYFGEHGVLSIHTMMTGKRWDWPGPDDGYEWEDSVCGEYIKSTKGPVAWKAVCDLNDCQIEELIESGWERFSVSRHLIEFDEAGYEKLEDALVELRNMIALNLDMTKE